MFSQPCASNASQLSKRTDIKTARLGKVMGICNSLGSTRESTNPNQDPMDGQPGARQAAEDRQLQQPVTEKSASLSGRLEIRAMLARDACSFCPEFSRLLFSNQNRVFFLFLSIHDSFLILFLLHGALGILAFVFTFPVQVYGRPKKQNRLVLCLPKFF